MYTAEPYSRMMVVSFSAAELDLTVAVVPLIIPMTAFECVCAANWMVGFVFDVKMAELNATLKALHGEVAVPQDVEESVELESTYTTELC